jgi:hypothetical protein
MSTDKGFTSSSVKSIKTLPFSGKKKEKFREWWRKLKAIAAQDGWLLALETERDMNEVLKEGEKVVIDDSLIEYIKMNDHGLNFLVLSLQDDAWRYVEQAKTLYEAGQNLKARYEYAEKEDLVELNTRFQRCVMKGASTDPELWFYELEYLRNQIVSAGGQKKPDEELVAHVLVKAPEEYLMAIQLINASEVSGTSTTLPHVKRMLHNFWKHNIDPQRTSKTESEALMTQMTQPNSASKVKPWRKCKGNCNYCGK